MQSKHVEEILGLYHLTIYVKHIGPIRMKQVMLVLLDRYVLRNCLCDKASDLFFFFCCIYRHYFVLLFHTEKIQWSELHIWLQESYSTDDYFYFVQTGRYSMFRRGRLHFYFHDNTLLIIGSMEVTRRMRVTKLMLMHVDVTR